MSLLTACCAYTVLNNLSLSTHQFVSASQLFSFSFTHVHAFLLRKSRTFIWHSLGQCWHTVHGHICHLLEFINSQTEPSIFFLSETSVALAKRIGLSTSFEFYYYAFIRLFNIVQCKHCYLAMELQLFL